MSYENWLLENSHYIKAKYIKRKLIILNENEKSIWFSVQINYCESDPFKFFAFCFMNLRWIQFIPKWAHHSYPKLPFFGNKETKIDN